MLTAVLAKMRDYRQQSAPNWQQIILELRAEAAPFRAALGDFLQAVREDEASPADLKRFFEPFLDRVTLGQQWGSVVKIVGHLAASYLTHDPAKSMQGIGEAFALKPLEFFQRWTSRRRVRFLLDAAKLASEAKSLEGQCKDIWGRGFTEQEKTYLTRVSGS